MVHCGTKSEINELKCGTFSRYQEFLSELLEQRVIKTYESDRNSSNEMTTVFNPACALLLDFACFPIFCHSDSETVDQIQLTDFSFPGQEGNY